MIVKAVKTFFEKELEISKAYGIVKSCDDNDIVKLMTEISDVLKLMYQYEYIEGQSHQVYLYKKWKDISELSWPCRRMFYKFAVSFSHKENEYSVVGETRTSENLKMENILLALCSGLSLADECEEEEEESSHC